MPASSFATGVDPVNVTFFTSLLSHISLPTSVTFFSVVTMLMTPAGTPAREASCQLSVLDCIRSVFKICVPQRVREQRRVSLVEV